MGSFRALASITFRILTSGMKENSDRARWKAKE